MKVLPNNWFKTLDLSVLHFIQQYFIPGMPVIALALTLLFTLWTARRLSLVGQGEQPVEQGEGGDSVPQETTKVTSGKVKRSIVCLLIVHAFFVFRAFYFYIFVNPARSNLYSETRYNIIMRYWTYDFMAVAFSIFRIAAYYMFCRNEETIPHTAKL